MMAEIHCNRLVPPDVAFSAFSIVYLHLRLALTLLSQTISGKKHH